MKRRILLCLAYVLAALCTAGCIYDYTPVVEGQKNLVVIEGDILVGSYTQVRLSTVRSLETPFSELPVTEWPAGARAWVEASDGTRYADENGSIDTRFADPDLEYRLLVTLGERSYVSSWEKVLRSADIEEMTYSVSDDHQTLTVAVTTRGDDSNRYYHWTAREDWEYHSPYSASFYFVPAGTYDHGEWYGQNAVVPFRDGENIYYCWSTSRVEDLLLASAEALSENRLVRHELYDINCHERRISYIYSVELTQEALSETAYRYWETMRKNSGDVGGLFSPEPFEMRGNLSCQEDPDAVVVGYISATVPSVSRLFIYGEDIGFYRMSEEDRKIYEINYISAEKREWARLYSRGIVPYMHTPMGGPDDFDWIDKRCVDCRVWGRGNKNKPDFWPNDHK